MNNKFTDQLNSNLLAPGHSRIIAPLFRLKFAAPIGQNVENKQLVFYEDLAFAKTLEESIKDRSFYKGITY